MPANSDDIDLLRGLLGQYSPSERERPAVEYLVGEMARRGFGASIDGAGNAVGVIGAARGRSSCWGTSTRSRARSMSAGTATCSTDGARWMPKAR